MSIRPYCIEDKEDCLRIFKSNLPKYFDLSELKYFIDWLQARADNKIAYSNSLADHYYVLLEEKRVVACGGFYILKNAKNANLSWGMVDADYHKNGFGSEILKFRLNEIKKLYPGYGVRMDTSQHTWPFYNKLGFQVKEITENAYAPGLHKYEMLLEVEL